MVKKNLKAMMTAGLLMVLVSNAMAQTPTTCGDSGTVWLTGDITGPANTPDCYVDIFDLSGLSAQWLDSTGTSYIYTLSGSDVQDGHVGYGSGSANQFDQNYLLADGVPSTQHHAALVRFDLSSLPDTEWAGLNVASYKTVAAATLRLECTSVNQTDPAQPLYCSSTNGNWNTNATYTTTDGTTPWPPGQSGVSPWTDGQVWCAANNRAQTSAVITETGPVTLRVTESLRPLPAERDKQAIIPEYGFQLHPYIQPDFNTDYPDFTFASSEAANGPQLDVVITDPYVSPRPTPPYIAWFQPALIVAHPELYSNMNVDAGGSLDAFWSYERGINRLAWAYGPQSPYAPDGDEVHYFVEQASRRRVVAQGYVPDDPTAYTDIITAGVAIDEWGTFAGWFNYSYCVEAYRQVKAADPCAFIAVWAVGYPSQLVTLVQEGTVDLWITEAYTWGVSFPTSWSSVQSRLNTARADGILDKMICALGEIDTADGTTEAGITSKIVDIATNYPECPGIAFYQGGSVADTAANRALMQHCNTISATYWPAATRFTPRSWEPLYSEADVSKDGFVNLVDFALMTENWMKCSDPANSACDPYWN
ncbi:MAG: hypothetical protein JW936_05835 [Sedimentisphaerales bacterium]|nr:hypothetical protein [Sedimentisphaerales bacterium]